MNPEELMNDNTGGDINKGKKESPLVSLETDLKFFNESIREVAVEIMAEGVSMHPIFIAHQHEMKLGEVILDKDELNTEWSVHASTIEEFTERGIIKKELKERFLKTYKDPHEYMCVFVVVPEGANFVYYPYVKE
ncbi:hypothetical protein [Mucilaginibacter segetis]|uniref:Uncharacterized protein n=1 Tax=Mucilaginibacter segetis TaxID=2793071 RepID=A0A934PR48_9SPHI|nr:hypothetical protein [Mucilaginibacter segetis]MBK0377922.1 hypothetical protein [Mucilaginibacter segetis]